MKYTTLFMDADDTLFDFPKCEYNALKHSLEANGLVFDDMIHSAFSRINKALWKKFEVKKITRAQLRVARFRELIELCFGNISGEDLTEKLADKYIEMLAEQAILIEGAFESLERLSSIYSIHIITNGLKPVQRKRFIVSGIEKYVSGIYISDEMGTQKPSKEFFDKVLADISEKDKRKILVVGDSLTSDMQGGRNAGLDTCIYDPEDKIVMPHPLCDYKIRSLDELAGGVFCG